MTGRWRRTCGWRTRTCVPPSVGVSPLLQGETCPRREGGRRRAGAWHWEAQRRGGSGGRGEAGARNESSGGKGRGVARGGAASGVPRAAAQKPTSNEAYNLCDKNNDGTYWRVPPGGEQTRRRLVCAEWDAPAARRGAASGVLRAAAQTPTALTSKEAFNLCGHTNDGRYYSAQLPVKRARRASVPAPCPAPEGRGSAAAGRPDAAGRAVKRVRGVQPTGGGALQKSTSRATPSLKMVVQPRS